MTVAFVQYPNANLANIMSGTVFNLPSSSPAYMVVNWNAADTSAKTQYVPPPSVMPNNAKIIITDKKGNAGTYPINISIFGGIGTIDNATSAQISNNNESITLNNDGTGNYTLI